MKFGCRNHTFSKSFCSHLFEVLSNQERCKCSPNHVLSFLAALDVPLPAKRENDVIDDEGTNSLYSIARAFCLGIDFVSSLLFLFNFAAAPVRVSESLSLESRNFFALRRSFGKCLPSGGNFADGTGDGTSADQGDDGTRTTAVSTDEEDDGAGADETSPDLKTDDTFDGTSADQVNGGTGDGTGSETATGLLLNVVQHFCASPITICL